MKKVISMMAVAGLFTVSMAQAQVNEVVEIAEVPVSKYSVQTNSFWDNWFVSLNAGAQFSYLYPEGSQEFKDRITFSGLAYVGKWFTPGIGMRLAANGYKFQGYSSKLDYVNLHVDALMNVTNMIMGYNPDRLYSMVPYVGMGGVRVFDHDTYSFGFNAGILNTFRLSDSWSVNLEMGALPCQVHETPKKGLEVHKVSVNTCSLGLDLAVVHPSLRSVPRRGSGHLWNSSRDVPWCHPLPLLMCHLDGRR